MGRKATGQVLERKGKRGTVFALRFRAYGERQYVTLGRAEDGWNQARAEEEMANVLADVRRGIWRPAVTVEPEAPRAVPTFHEFATDWLDARTPELRPKTIVDYKWALCNHLLPFFAGHKLDAITAEEVDRYKVRKLSEGQIGPNAINKTLTRIAQILGDAVEYGYMERNPAQGRRRRVKGTKPKRAWVEPEQLPSLLDAGDQYLRPILATLAGAGVRIGEAVALDWGELNLATGTLRVLDSKTEAGAGRSIDLPAGLVEDLTAHKQRAGAIGRTDPVFVNRRGNRQTVRNVHARLKKLIPVANERLAELGIDPIADAVSPHALRRTYSSIRAALRDDPVYIAEQMGHKDARFTFSVYQRAAKRRERLSGHYAAEFDRALAWASLRRSGEQEPEHATFIPSGAPRTVRACLGTSGH